ncbi:MAG: TlpA family protein disulfide reductase [Bacteroidaceae bacterium]|nr:TlpA family protein disulfide reductase [Bacteroidaceae bacterium]
MKSVFLSFIMLAALTLSVNAGNEPQQPVAQQSEKKATVRKIDSHLGGTEIFNSIISEYKGKKILVDFWATWCGPCRAAMKTIEPLKEELWNDVVFVYVTGETSPKETWQKMYPKINGDHYYVTDAQWNALLNQFNTDGIPTYVIVDKEGKVLNKHIGFPGNDMIREELK